MHDSRNICPVCGYTAAETGFYNKVFKQKNVYCSNCESFHIPCEINTSEYYAGEYHKAFNYGSLPKIMNFFGFVGNRAIARILFYNKIVKPPKNENFLEIGGGKGDNFTVINKKFKPNRYIIVEPNSEYNLKYKKVKYINDLFENVDNKQFTNVNTVFMFHVLEHIFDLDRFFKKITAINPEYFYFEVPNCNNEKAKEDSLLNHPHYHHFTKKTLEFISQKYNFNQITISEIEPKSYHPYMKVSKLKKIFSRVLAKHETISKSGIYLRAIFKIRK